MQTRKIQRSKGLYNCLDMVCHQTLHRTLDYPLLIGGDWLLWITFSPNHLLICAVDLKQIRLNNLYHYFNNLDFHESKHSTFRHSSGKLHHLDHFFGSSFFYEKHK